MVESRYVLYGLIAGAVSGLVLGIMYLLYVPSVDEVLEEARHYISIGNVSEDILRNYISISLLLTPFIAFVFLLVLGAVLGALYEYLDKKITGPPLLSAIATGAVYALLLIVPNILLGASYQKILSNSIVVTSYTLALIAMTIYKTPRRTRDNADRLG